MLYYKVVHPQSTNLSLGNNLSVDQDTKGSKVHVAAVLNTREKSFCKTSFHLRITGAEKRTETRQR